MKQYTVDLSQHPTKRWNNILSDPWAKKWAKKLSYASYKNCEEALGFWSNVIKVGACALIEIFGEEYSDDMYVWGNGPIGDVGVTVCANLGYELTQASNRLLCSSVAVKTKLGMVHARNLDWELPGIRNATIIINYKNSNCGDFSAVTMPGFIGVLSGIAKGRFSATINLAPCKEISIFDKWSSPLLLRHVFENCRTYDEAVQFLKSASTVSPTFIQIVGVKNGESCVVETMPKSANKVHCYNNEPLAVTNHYLSRIRQPMEQEELDWSEDRLGKLESVADKCKIETLSDGFKLINKYPIYHEGTVQQMVFCPKTGEFFATT